MIGRLRSLAAVVLERGRFEREMDAEMRFHLEAYAADLTRSGVSEAEARRRARLAFGHVGSIQEDCRQSRGLRFVDELRQDLRHALRQSLRRAPGLALAIVLTIGLGLGAAAAIFATTGAALVDPLPYAEQRRLIHLWEVRDGTGERSPTSYPTLLDWRSRARSVSAFEGYDPSNVTVGVGDETRMLRGAQVTVGFFGLLRVPMSAGRDFLHGEDATSGASVAIVSDGFARSVGGGSALGRTITINGAPSVIVGVLPSAFHFALLQNADLFVPLVADGQRRADRSQRSIQVIGRLQDGVPLTAARAELSAVMSELAGDHPDALSGRTVAAVPLRDALLRSIEPVLASLTIAVALLLVIMGANLALLMLTRYVERAPELAMRFALGATRGRVLRQLLVESLAPSLAGAAVAVFIGQAATHALLSVIPEGVRIGMPYLANVGLDARVIAVMVGLTTILAAAFGLGPALLVTKGVGRPGDTRTTHARGDRRLRRALLAAQMALTVVLLVSSGLLVVSYANLLRRDVGFLDPARLVTARVPLSGHRYQEPVAQQGFYEALLARSAAVPGVRAAGAVDEVPGAGGRITTIEPVDRPRPRSIQPRAALRFVGGEYFSTMGIPIVAGRAFESRDRSDAPPVAVVSAGFARMLAEDGAAVGRRLRLAATGQAEWEVVGIVGDVHVAALDADSPPVVYLSHLQAAENRMTLVLRTEMDVSSVASQVRAIVETLDRGVPVYSVSTLHRQMIDSRAVFSRRLPMILCGVFAAAALALTLVALYAIFSHDVLTRRREFGIRIALGGSARTIRRLVLDEALLVGAAGIGIGGVLAVLVSRSMQAVLFGITATDWRVYGVVTAAVLASAFLATCVPAFRAGSVNPAIVMRQE